MTQTTTLMPEGRQRYFNNDGTPAAGCLLYTYAAGTTTPKVTYSDSAGVTPNANPVVLDAKGEAVIYWTGAYKVDLKTAASVQITGYPVDNINTDPLGIWSLITSAGAAVVGYIANFANAVATTVQAKLRERKTTPDWGNSLALAVTDIGSTVTTLVVNGNISVTDDLTIPSTLSINIESGAVITISGGKTLTINGPFEAGVYNVFGGGGLVVFGEGSASEYYPEWWLAAGGEFGAAASKCLAATANTGAKVVFTKSHTCTTPINATGNHRGWVIEGRGGSGAAADWGVTIAFGHTGVGFDCSDSEHIHFRNFKIKGGALGTISIYPKVGILFARNAAGSGCGKHTLENVQTDYTSKFSVAAIYNYGGEEMSYINCHIYNNVAAKKTVVTTCANVSSVASSFLTLSSASNLSTTVHKFLGGAYWGAVGGASTDVFYIDGASEFTVDGALLLNDTGRSLFYIDTTHAVSADFFVHRIRDEGGSTGSTYGILVGAGSNNPTNMVISENVLRSVTRTLYVDDTITPDRITYANNIDPNAAGISVLNLNFSRINNNTSFFVQRAGGLLSSCDISGNFVSMTFGGSLKGCDIRDLQYSSLYAPGNGSTYNYPVGTLTLAANAGTTVFNLLPFIKSNSTVLLTPTSANAAADVGSATGVYVSAISAGTSFTITHPNNANADKSFNYMIYTGG